MTPIAYALLNPATGKIDVTKVYVHEEAARAGAVRYSSRWPSDNPMTDEAAALVDDLAEALAGVMAVTDDPANDADPEESIFAFARQALTATADRGDQSIVAVSPESAARKLYWRLTEDQRSAMDRIIIWRPKRGYGNTPAYEGPEVVFRVVGGRMVERERRE